MNYTVEDIISIFEKRGIFTRSDYTFEEYVNQLNKYQETVSEIITGNPDGNIKRLNEVADILESSQIEGGTDNTFTSNGIETLNFLNTEIAIAFAGKCGEERVADTYQYVKRDDASFYRNIYLSDGFNETEIDTIVLTRNGFIILEIKNAKEDVTITKDGRLLMSNSICKHEVNIGEKMDKKRYLLSKILTDEFHRLGINKRVIVDSMIVFSTPSGVRIQVHDEYKKENYGFRGTLYRRIDNFQSTTNYTYKELKSLNNVLENMTSIKKRFSIRFDPMSVKMSFAEAYVAYSKALSNTGIDKVKKLTFLDCFIRNMKNLINLKLAGTIFNPFNNNCRVGKETL